MKNSQWRWLVLVGVVLLGGALFLWQFPSKPEEEPTALIVIQTRAASETESLQALFEEFRQVKVSYLDASILREKAGTGLLPDFDLLLSDEATLSRLNEHKELIAWEENRSWWPLYEEGFQLLFYNKKLTKTIPATWQDLVGLTVAQSSQSQKRYGLSMPEEAFAVMPFISRALLDGKGAPLKTGKEAWLREGLEELQTLRMKFSLTPRDCTAECAAQVFLSGQAPFALAGEWRWREFANRLGADLGMAPLPKFTSGPSVSARSAVMVAASRSTRRENVPMLADLIKDLRGSEGSARIFARLGKLPTSYIEDKETAQNEQARELSAIARLSTVQVDESVYLKLLAELRPAIQSYLNGDLELSELIDRLQRDATSAKS